MNGSIKRFILLFLFVILGAELAAQGAGTWVPLANYPPGAAGHLLLLSDGTVLAENLSTNYGPGWFRLTPDIHGSYVNGTWSTIAAMHDTRLDFASDVLKDGRVLVAGGEYGSGIATSEVYDPSSNTWTIVPVPTSLLNPASPSPEAGENQGFSDSISIVVANGKVLVAPVAGNTLGATMLFDPAGNTWSAGPTTFEKGYPDQAEASWVKLADNSILTVDGGATTAERYIPASNSWIKDTSAPVTLYDSFGEEEGPGLLLPNGKAIFFGGSGHTCIYSPSGNTNLGSWVAGPDFPSGKAMPDAPAAMMVNGKILCAVTPAPTSGNHFPTPTSFYEYDYLSNSFTPVSAPGGGAAFSGPAWPTLMLALPDGSVLFTHRSFDLYVYKPDGVPLDAGRPTITSITTNGDGSLHLTGTGFNGLSQGAAYGDDEQMDSNFPLVRFIDGFGNVRYGRTYNWSSTGVATGNTPVSTDCTIPAGASLQDTIQVVANGIGSLIPPTVLITNDNGAGSLRQLIAIGAAGSTINFSPNLSGKTITLTNTELLLNKNLTIDASALPSGIAIDGKHHSRIFNVASGANVVLSALTLTNGYSGSGNWGGAIINYGFLTLSNCTLSGNSVDGNVSGGAIDNLEVLNLYGCALIGNSAGYGGAIESTYVCSLQNCTLFGNTCQHNGGTIDNNAGSLALSQCTFSANAATGGVGGAADNYMGTMTLTNCILAGNNALAGEDVYNWASSTLTVGGTNIVPLLANAGTMVSPGTVLTAAPLLASPGKYGGPTATMPPLPDSPAIDGGSDAAASGIAIDQRGYSRLSGAHVDIGATEVQIASTSPVLKFPSVSGVNGFQFSFSNLMGGSFTVFASTNPALPLNAWSNIGAAIENPAGSGQFQFTDPQPLGQATRFYTVRSP